MVPAVFLFYRRDHHLILDIIIDHRFRQELVGIRFTRGPSQTLPQKSQDLVHIEVDRGNFVYARDLKACQDLIDNKLDVTSGAHHYFPFPLRFQAPLP